MRQWKSTTTERADKHIKYFEIDKRTLPRTPDLQGRYSWHSCNPADALVCPIDLYVRLRLRTKSTASSKELKEQDTTRLCAYLLKTAQISARELKFEESHVIAGCFIACIVSCRLRFKLEVPCSLASALSYNEKTWIFCQIAQNRGSLRRACLTREHDCRFLKACADGLHKNLTAARKKAI